MEEIISTHKHQREKMQQNLLNHLTIPDKKQQQEL